MSKPPVAYAMTAARWLALAMLSAALPALACTPAPPLSGVAAREAKQVFVFQLTASRLAAPPEEVEGTVYGEIRVLKVLRGNAAISPKMRFYTGVCAGTRLDTGHYYVAFVPDARPGWWASQGSVIHLGASPPLEGDADMAEVRKVLDGRIALEHTSLIAGRDFVASGWPPPPPLPLPRKAAKPIKPRMK
ncbi:hypothetical protein ASE35_20025 [Lysobacter sp. Root916]|uniref:hypothetical protein n=1 Tax=Lysobacter sp. Root916 TaxID=1736606 RepID=UPI00070E67DA|nr:hypothetical protein [Lysobacter sp. Root916]KRD28564.1 hypothetical protein ASE35_20025 [Lysobacter sp. Root916]